ncbi:MAG: hypothetical protein HZB13_15220, partial [Acidobacteria bacterium]|nr:hypothetical protein [Acidobacteriota bacterium]
MNRRSSCLRVAFYAALALVVLVVPSSAAVISDYPLLAMTPNAGDLQIGAGGTDGWGFILYNRRPVYLVVTSGDLTPSPAGFGTFDPFLGVNPVSVGPGSLAVPTMLIVPYDFFARSGFGSITVDAGVPDWT